MLLQTFDALTIVYILIATVLFWLMLWLATRIVVSKDFASDKKFMLLLTALLMVVLAPIITSALVSVLVWVGGLMVDLRGLLGGGGHNYVTGLAPIISFLIFMILLKFLVGMDWKDTTWVALIGIFLLYVFYSLVPELIFMGALLLYQIYDRFALLFSLILFILDFRLVPRKFLDPRHQESESMWVF